MSKSQRRWVVTLVRALAAVSVFCFLGWAVNSWLDPFDDQPFDIQAWAAAEDRERDRGPMARGAIRQIPPGTSKERVRELLGEAWVTPAGGDRWGVAPRHGETWAYYVGGHSGLGPYNMDAAFVYVHFDQNDRVVEAEITGG